MGEKADEEEEIEEDEEDEDQGQGEEGGMEDVKERDADK